MRCVIGSLCLLGGTTAAHAQIFQIHDLNSTVTFDLGPVAPGTRGGMVGWEVNGIHQLFQQWFWFRTAAMPREERLNVLPLIGAATFNANAIDPRDDTFTAAFGALGGLVFELRFSVQGSVQGDLRSDIAEQIRISNTSQQPVALSFFQYCDLDLGGDINDDIVQVLNPNAVMQADFVSGGFVSETVTTPRPDLSEVDIYPATLTRLDDGLPTVLNGSTGPLAGRRDYTWAWQWDFALLPGQSFLISKDKNLVPAPGPIATIGLSLLLLARRRR